MTSHCMYICFFKVLKSLESSIADVELPFEMYFMYLCTVARPQGTCTCLHGQAAELMTTCNLSAGGSLS